MIKFAVKHPVTIAMGYLCLLVLAYWAVSNIPLSLTPNLSFPRLTVISYYAGSTPEEVESEITSKIEAIGSQIEGIKSVSSNSYSARSVVELKFNRETDMDFARFELNEKLRLLTSELPDDVVPRISAYIPDDFGESTFFRIGIYGPYTLDELAKNARKHLLNPISSLDGVDGQALAGQTKKQITIEIDDYNLSLVNTSLIRSKLINLGKHESFKKVNRYNNSWVIEVDDRFEKITELKKVPITRYDGTIVELGSIAKITQDYTEAYYINRYNGLPQITLTIEKSNQANALKLAKQIKQLIKKQKPKLLKGIQTVVLEDESKTIENDMNSLYKRGGFSLIIIFIVLLVFLRKISSTVIVLFTIFFSTALTLILMYQSGVGLNMLSMAGLALGFGMMVDNSIVIYENIFRNQAKGRANSAISGAKEVALPIIASTLTTIIVFAPFLYMQGKTKIFYLPFAAAMAFALLSSLVVSFTFIPLMASKMPAKLKAENESHFSFKFNWFQKFLKLLIKWRWIWIIVVCGILGTSSWIFATKIKRGFEWGRSDDSYIGIQITQPVGTEISKTDVTAKAFEKLVVDDETVKSVKTSINGRHAFIRIDFDEETKKTAYPLIVREKLKAYAANFGNTSANIFGFGPSFGFQGVTTASYSIELKGHDYLQLKQICEEVANYLQKKSRRVTNVDLNSIGWSRGTNLTEYSLRFNRYNLAKYRVSIESLINQIYSYISSSALTIDKRIADEEYTIKVLDETNKIFNIDDLKQLIVTADDYSKVKLDELVFIEKKEMLSEIEKDDELYIRRINFDFRGSRRKGDKIIKKLKKTYPLPIGYSFVKETNWWGLNEDDEQLTWLLVFAVILVYMALAALFESFKYPFVILLTLPLAFVGVALIFYFTNQTFTASARIGLVLLAGIVVNNSIIMVDHILLLQKKGLARLKAVIQAAKDRLRPILMTSLTTICGLLPMLMQDDASKSDFWRLLSLSTIGGMFTSTLFVLTFIPVIFLFFSPNRSKGHILARKVLRKNKKARKKGKL